MTSILLTIGQMVDDINTLDEPFNFFVWAFIVIGLIILAVFHPKVLFVYGVVFMSLWIASAFQRTAYQRKKNRDDNRD